jgi:hypothetical protein
MLQVLYINVAKVDCDVAYVSSACPKCFICFRRMLQVFCLDVAEVDLYVAYICIMQAYVSRVFRCFIRMFASVSYRCCICLQWFLNVFQTFSHVFHTLVSSVSSIFFCMLQVLHLNV